MILDEAISIKKELIQENMDNLMAELTKDDKKDEELEGEVVAESD